ncbi:MAG: hypothetical protein V9E99_09695 [Microthrixaceae bacterium]
MGTDKRARQKEQSRSRAEAARKEALTTARKRRFVNLGLLGAVLVVVIGVLVIVGQDDDKTGDKSSSTTTTSRRRRNGRQRGDRGDRLDDHHVDAQRSDPVSRGRRLVARGQEVLRGTADLHRRGQALHRGGVDLDG